MLHSLFTRDSREEAGGWGIAFFVLIQEHQSLMYFQCKSDDDGDDDDDDRNWMVKKSEWTKMGWRLLIMSLFIMYAVFSHKRQRRGLNVITRRCLPDVCESCVCLQVRNIIITGLFTQIKLCISLNKCWLNFMTMMQQKEKRWQRPPTFTIMLCDALFDPLKGYRKSPLFLCPHFYHLVKKNAAWQIVLGNKTKENEQRLCSSCR